LILTHAHESADALLGAYELVRTTRGASRGAGTDEEQDLLRAMLVMAAAGLDSMNKQLVRDALPLILQRNHQAQLSFEKFISRRISDDLRSTESGGVSKFLARALSKIEPQKQLIEDYITDLTWGSLQSVEALFQLSAALGLLPQDIGVQPPELKPIFETRNKIIHELDIDLTAARRNRFQRRQGTMIRDTNRLLSVGTDILNKVDALVR